MKFVFLIYDSRSGSTFLAALLDSVLGISVIPETDFINRILVARKGRFDQVNAQGLIDFLRQEPHFGELKIDETRLLHFLEKSTEVETCKKVVEAIFETSLSGVDGENIYATVMKCGASIFHMQKLQEDFPSSCFLHIVRDGRAVCASKMRSDDSWGKKFDPNVIGNALHWKKRMKIVRSFTGNLIEVSYEGLVTDPKREIDRICDELSIPVGSRIQTNTLKEYSKKIGARQKHLHTNIGDPITSRISKWESDLNWYEVGVFEKIAGKQLVMNGYELKGTADWGAFRYIEFSFRFLWLYVDYWIRRIGRIGGYFREDRLLERLRIWLLN